MGREKLFHYPKVKKHVGCQWVYTIKQKVDGTIERYKVRLVVKGFTQTYGVDYQKKFALVAKMNTIQVLLSLAVNMDRPLKQFIKNAFIHGDLEDEVYIDFPPGYGVKSGYVNVALHGLKQSIQA